jgi:hypothetical protein
MMRLLAVAVLAVTCLAAWAQLRTIPQDAKRGEIRHLQEMMVEVDGRPVQLAPGAQIRDADNRIVVPTAVPPGTLVKYRVDANGMIREAWVLSPQEAAQPDKR